LTCAKGSFFPHCADLVVSLAELFSMRILTLCGSLRARSSNRAILRAYASLAPASTFTHYERIGALPHFNPDLERDDAALPPEVLELRRLVSQAEALVISTPEYVHALPGSFKNALDWLVGDPAFAGKPVAILHVERGSTWAIDSLREVLRTMSAQIIEAASVTLPLPGNQVDEAAVMGRDEVRALLVRSVGVLQAAIKT
jgi:chromate reductase